MQSWTDERTAVANACRVLAYRGLVSDVLGHVSVRVGEDAVLVRCRGPKERGLAFTTAEDVHEVGLDGSHDLPDGWSVPNELPLHLAVIAASPETRSVVHAHPPAVVAMTLTGVPLRPIVGAYNIPAMQLATAGIPVHPSSALIRTRARADAMLASMGHSPVVLLSGHGLTAAGATIQQAVIRALNVDALARMHLSVLSTGAVPSDIDDGDRDDLPDLGSAFNDEAVWRYHLAALEHEARLSP
ncbi:MULTISPECIES: class II aldolase/adducin family protein [unclassified Microbacterium]|uniref:class II aldolase/adducin family protein n=1 Tax=unclassified Microbacterium TaxID=2609290 RepID=UPI00095B6552|nr:MULTISPECIES: class II aldolase/adducin family protein [unclassified Microbacterium]OJV93327.1 MAG: aldolase [Microbacterium sp. 67-17]